MKVKKIKWVEGTAGFDRGYVNHIRLFECGYDVLGMENTETPFVLSSYLPGIKTFHCKEMEECKIKAQYFLVEFVKYLLD